MILVDTSVWVAHLRYRLSDLTRLLDRQLVLMHPFVLGELACGQLHQRTAILRMLSELPCAISATNNEVLRMIEDRQLWGKGIGLVDFHLLASTAVTGCRFWTSDLRLAEMAKLLGLEWPHKTH